MKSSAPSISSNLANLHRNRSQNQKSLATNVGNRLIQSRENVSEKSFSYLKDKIRRFENPPNNIHENIINRSTTSTTIKAEEATADVDPVKSVSENDQRIYYDKNSRFTSSFLINRDESQSQRIPSERCSVSDGNNNQVKELKNQRDSDTNNSFKSSLTARQLRDINTHCCVNGDDIKVTKVVIRHLAPNVERNSPVSRQHQQHIVHKQSSFNDNDFSFIDSSSRSVSRSSSTSFASDEHGLCGEKVNPRKARTPKIARINNWNYSQEFSVKAGANQNIYSLDQSENSFVRNGWDATSHKNANLNRSNNLEKSTNGQHLKASTNNFAPPNANQSAAEKSVSLKDKQISGGE